MHENRVLAIYKGFRSYVRKDGTEGILHKFADNNKKEYEIFVKEEVKDIPIDSAVWCIQVSGSIWNNDLNRYENKIFYKSVELAKINK